MDPSGFPAYAGQFPWRPVLIGAGIVYLGGMVISLAVGIPVFLWIRKRQKEAEAEIKRMAAEQQKRFREFMVPREELVPAIREPELEWWEWREA